MDFIYLREYIEDGQVAVVDCTMQSNVMLTDDGNFSNFKNGSKYTYFGGFFTHFPAFVFPPSSGYWNISIDLGAGYSGEYEYSINVLPLESSGWWEDAQKPDSRRDGESGSGGAEFFAAGFDFFG
jgi:hypothetical protein